MSGPPDRRAGRPVVGITAYEERASWNDWDDTAAVLPSNYLRALEQAGGVGVIIPVQRLSSEDALLLLARVDGLIIAGGPDVSPARYGSLPHPLTSEQTESRLNRDALEAGLLDTATAAKVPTLAICRGLQLLNVTRGGSLHQHLPDVVGNLDHVPEVGDWGAHEVTIAAQSRLAGILGRERCDVPTHHHQAVDVLGEGLEAVAFADDGTIEAVEDKSLPFLVGVQWHPEVSDDLSLFRALVGAACA